MKIRQFQTVTAIEPLYGRLWFMYRRTFDSINRAAALRHLMNVDEFSSVVADPGITKYVGFDDEDRVVAFGASTPRLERVPLISPAFYRERYGDNFVDDSRLWYVLFIGVTPDAGRDAYAQMLREMARPIAAVNGVAALDMCAQNLDGRRLGKATHRILQRGTWPTVGAPTMHTDDSQSFIAYDFRTSADRLTAPA